MFPYLISPYRPQFQAVYQGVADGRYLLIGTLYDQEFLARINALIFLQFVEGA